MPTKPRSPHCSMARLAQAAPLLLLLASLPAQEPAVRASDPQVPVRIRTVEPGKQVPRIPAPLPDDGPAARVAFSVEGRKIEWRLGKTVCGDEAAVDRELQTLADEPSNWRTPTDGHGKEPIPLVIAPDPDVRWTDVLRFYDRAIERRMNYLQLAEIGPVAHWFVVKGVMDPVIDDGGHVVPKIVYNEPDDGPPRWRPVILVRQTGAIEFGGKLVFDAARHQDDKPLRELFADLARQSREKDGSKEFGPDKLEVCDTELLFHVDQWCRYESVHRVLRAAASSKPAFWRFTFACGEYDFEQRLRNGDRFKK